MHEGPMSSERTMVPMVLVVASRLVLKDMESFDKALWKSFQALNNAYAEVITNNGCLDLFFGPMAKGKKKHKGRCAPMEKGAMEIQMEIQHATCRLVVKLTTVMAIYITGYR